MIVFIFDVDFGLSREQGNKQRIAENKWMLLKFYVPGALTRQRRSSFMRVGPEAVAMSAKPCEQQSAAAVLEGLLYSEVEKLPMRPEVVKLQLQHG